MKKKEKLMVSVRFDAEVMRKIKKQAQHENRSFNNMVDTIVKGYIKSEGL